MTQVFNVRTDVAMPADESENIFRTIIESSPDPICILQGEDMIVIVANQPCLDFWQAGRDAIGKPLFGILPEMRDQGYPNWLMEVYQQGKKVVGKEVPGTFHRKDGTQETFYFNFTYQPYRKTDGAIAGVLVTAADVTSMVENRRQVEESERRFRLMADTIPEMIWVTDAQGKNEFLNKRWEEYSGLPFREATADEIAAEAVHPEDAPKVMAAFQKGIKTGQGFEVEQRNRSASGEYRWFLNRAMPYRDPETGEITKWFGIGIDIHDRKMTEQALRESEDHFRALVNATSDVVYQMNADWSEMKELAGRGFLADMGQPSKGWLERYIHPNDRSRVIRAIRKAIDTRSMFELEHQILQADGSMGWTVSRAVPIFDSKGEIVEWFGAATDVTQRRRAEEAIKESEALFRSLAHSMPQVVWIAESKGNVTYYNDQVGVFDGAEKLADGNWRWEGMVHPDDLAATDFAWKQAVATGAIYEKEHRIRMKDGTYRWHLSRGIPQKNEEGEVTKWFGTATDIHTQKTFTETLEKLVTERTGELQRSNEDLQQFAHVTSHDLKEPLRKIRVFASMLTNEMGSGMSERSAMYLAKIESAANRMYSMIDGVLLYSTMNAEELASEAVDLNALMQNIQTDLEVYIQEKQAAIATHQLPVVHGSPILLYQLFYNLINNSLKFAKKDVPLRINITWEKVPAPAVAFTQQKHPDYISIRVKDNGIGFDQSQAEKIFQTFTRLHSKSDYEGTGLGLSLCKKIAERHGGAINAEGRDGEGATFWVLLPVRQD